MFILIAYDIREDKRRVKIEKILSTNGIRVNYSLFEFIISKVKLKKLISEVKEIAKKEDSVRVYFLNRGDIDKSFDLNGENPPFIFGDSYV